MVALAKHRSRFCVHVTFEQIIIYAVHVRCKSIRPSKRIPCQKLDEEEDKKKKCWRTLLLRLCFHYVNRGISYRHKSVIQYAISANWSKVMQNEASKENLKFLFEIRKLKVRQFRSENWARSRHTIPDCIKYAHFFFVHQTVKYIDTYIYLVCLYVAVVVAAVFSCKPFIT